MKPFRLETITLDRDEHVRDVTVVVDAPYVGVIAGHLGVTANDVQKCVIRRERGDTELWIRLDVGDALKLRASIATTPSNRPTHIAGAYESLLIVENVIDSIEDNL
jgi:hypothetical protein